MNQGTANNESSSEGRADPDGDELVVEAPASVVALLGTVLERRYPLEAILEVRDKVCRLSTSHQIGGRRVDVRVAPVEASEATLIAFGHEAELVARLDHPGCPKVFEFGSESDGTLFTVVSPAPERELWSLLDAPLDPAEAVEIARQVLDTLAYVHAQGVVHCNVDAHSIRLSGAGKDLNVHLEDFSHAQLVSVDSEAADKQADLFGVAKLLYTLLAGYPPFAQDTMAAPRPMPASVPRPIAHIVMRMLSAKPEIQFSGAAQAAHALATWRDGPVTLVTGEQSDETEVESLRAAHAAAHESESSSHVQEAEPTEMESTPEALVHVEEPMGGRSWGWVVVVALLIGAGGLVIVLRPWEQPTTQAVAPAAATNAAPATEKGTAGPTEQHQALAAPAADRPSPATAGGVDLMQLLAVVNNADMTAAPNFGERQDSLGQLRASKNTAALIDEQFNSILDLSQASSAAKPCATFDAALSRLEDDLSDRSRTRLVEAEVTVVEPGTDETAGECDGHQARLDALVNVPAQATSAPGSRSRKRRSESRNRSRNRRTAAKPAETRDAPAAAASTSPSPTDKKKKKRKKKKKIDAAEKLDDELRPFSK